jgi:nucleoside-diphosphate-sugar epimerase
MRVLLTGGAGFIGSNLSRRLLHDGHEVTVLDTLDRNALDLFGIRGDVQLVQGTVLAPDLVHSLARGKDAIVHLAAVAGVDTVINHPIRTMDVISLGTTNALRSALAVEGLQRFVNFSTSEVYGPYAFHAKESQATLVEAVGPSRWIYAAAKLAAEHQCRAFFIEHGLPTVSMRPCNVYGPGQIGEGAIHNFVRASVSGLPIVVNGDGTQMRAWCHVDDMVEATVRALTYEQAVGEVFNVGNPEEPLTTLSLARRIRELTRSHNQIKMRPMPHEEVQVRVLDTRKASELLGWRPSVSLDDGIVETICWYEELRLPVAA